jgi:hypothetical protein
MIVLYPKLKFSKFAFVLTIKHTYSLMIPQCARSGVLIMTIFHPLFLYFQVPINCLPLFLQIFLHWLSISTSCVDRNH